MELYHETAQDSQGNVINNATVTVTLKATGAPATLYKEDGTTLGNPFSSGYDRSKGEVDFKAENGAYNVQVVSDTTTTIEVSLFDTQAIAKSLSGPASTVKVRVFDTADDFDGGAWREKMSHTSWERLWGKFPARIAVVVEPSKLWIFDADTGSLWTTFTKGGATWETDVNALGGNLSRDVDYKNGEMLVPSGAGTASLSLVDDTAYSWRSGGARGKGRYNGNLTKADDGLGYTSIDTSQTIASNSCNAVSITALYNSPLNYVDLPINTIDVYTDSGTSRINHDGTVADLVDTAADDHKGGAITRLGDSVSLNSTIGNLDLYLLSNTKADTNTPDEVYDEASTPALLEAVDAGDAIAAMDDNLAIGQDSGITLLARNPATPADGMVAYVTNSYATPYMKGDAEMCLTGSSITDRSAAGTAITDNGAATFTAVNSGDLEYTTAVGGTLTAPVTTGGECYGWEDVSGVWTFRENIASWTGVSEAAGTLTIADGTKFTRLVYVNGAAPSAEQLAEIERTDTSLFASGVSMLLPGASSAVVDIDYNASRGELEVTQSDYTATFRDLVLVDSKATQAGTLTTGGANGGVLLQGGSAGAYIGADAVDVKADLNAANQKIAELSNHIAPYTATLAAEQTIVLPQGYKAVDDLLISVDTTFYEFGTWSQSFDGFLWTVDMGSSLTGDIVIQQRID